MAKKNYKIRVKLTFCGEVTVRANSRQEAEEQAEKNLCGQLGSVQSLNEEIISDWNIETKSTTVVNRKEKEGKVCQAQ